MMCCVLWLLSLYIAYVCGQTTPVVNTSVGQIIGVADEFNKFLGIPYAVVDEKDPFRPAKPSPKFKSPYHATKDPVICPQLEKGVPRGNIHGLHLNIYTPLNTDRTKSLPVMVFIHGGAFVEGDGNFNTYSPAFLVQRDVIVVTMNYRLGPYGFLCLEENEYKNQGLRDQKLALDWIKDNIKEFGGDVGNILLFGHSAGSDSTEYHLLFDKNKVFNKVILQSLQLVSPASRGEPRGHEYLIDLAAKLDLGSRNRDARDIVRKLSDIDAALLINTTFNYQWRPCIEKSIINDATDLKDVKIIIGSASNEAVFLYKHESDYTKLIKQSLTVEFEDIDIGVVMAENFYRISGSEKQDAYYFGNDFNFNYPVERSIRHYLRSNATVYRYVFSYDGGRNYIKYRDNLTEEGATHGDELGYLFDADFLGGTINEDDQHVIDSLTTFWTDFAKYGNPLPFKGKRQDPWPKYEEDLPYMDIGLTSIKKTRYRGLEMSFWDSFYKIFGLHSRGSQFAEEAHFSKAQPRKLP